MQNQPKDSFSSDIRKDPRDCMAVTLRSGKELEERRVEKDTEEENYAEIGEQFKKNNSETIEEEKTAKMQPEQQVRN